MSAGRRDFRGTPGVLLPLRGLRPPLDRGVEHRLKGAVEKAVREHRGQAVGQGPDRRGWLIGQSLTGKHRAVWHDPFPVFVPDADRGRATFPNQTYHAIRRTALLTNRPPPRFQRRLPPPGFPSGTAALGKRDPLHFDPPASGCPQADAVLAYPLTFNSVNKFAHGYADNFAAGLLCEMTATTAFATAR